MWVWTSFLGLLGCHCRLQLLKTVYYNFGLDTLWKVWNSSGAIKSQDVPKRIKPEEVYDEPSGRNTKIKKTTLSRELEKGRYKLDFPDGESPSKRGGPPIKGKAERVPQSQGKSKGVKDKNLIQSDSQKEGKEMFEEERFENVELENVIGFDQELYNLLHVPPNCKEQNTSVVTSILLADVSVNTKLE